MDGERHVVGIVGEADLVRGRIVPEGWQAEGLPEPTVADVMTRDVVVVSPEDDLADVVAVNDTGSRSTQVVDPW